MEQKRFTVLHTEMFGDGILAGNRHLRLIVRADDGIRWHLIIGTEHRQFHSRFCRLAKQDEVEFIETDEPGHQLERDTATEYDKIVSLQVFDYKLIAS